MRTKLMTVEAARGLAALAVAFFHADASMRYMGHPTLPILSIGESGVDFFFVLSGFIIAYVHGKDVGKPERAFDYAAKRFIRLFPILWVVVGGWFLLRLALGDMPKDALGTSLLLYPSLTRPAPVVVWTLRHELLFYCAFVILIAHRRSGETLFGAWAGFCLGQLVLSLAGHPVTGLPAFFLSSFNLDFMLGMLVAWMHRRIEFRTGVSALWIGLAAVAAVTVARSTFHGGRTWMLDYVSVGATAWTLALGGAFALLLHGLLCAEGSLTVPKPLLKLGAASYSLYLVHTSLNSATQHVGALLPAGLGQLFVVAAALVGGWVVHTRIETPLAQLLRRGLAPRVRATG